MLQNGTSHRPHPVRRAARLGLCAALLFASLTGLGLLLTRVLTPSPVSRLDARVISWFAAQRTPTLSALSAIGSDLAMTLAVFVMTALVAVATLLPRRRLPAQ